MTQQRNPGRPAGSTKPTARRHTVGGRVNDGELAQLLELGAGQPARGIREALRILRERPPAETP